MNIHIWITLIVYKFFVYTCIETAANRAFGGSVDRRLDGRRSTLLSFGGRTNIFSRATVRALEQGQQNEERCAPERIGGGTEQKQKKKQKETKTKGGVGGQIFVAFIVGCVDDDNVAVKLPF